MGGEVRRGWMGCRTDWLSLSTAADMGAAAWFCLGTAAVAGVVQTGVGGVRMAAAVVALEALS